MRTSFLRIVPLALLVGACSDPRNASLSVGDYTAWLASTNSVTVAKGSVDFEGYPDYFTIDCRIPPEGGTKKQVDAYRLPGRKKICPDDRNPQWPPNEETWIEDIGVHVLHADLDPWKGSALLTSEGDAQVFFHQRLPGGSDFRFGFVIDPDFNPRECIENEAGDGVVYEPIDGDWLAEWSRGQNGATRYYLNSGASQFNPDDVSGGQPTAASDVERWFIPLEWRAGHAEGKFADDFFRNRSTRYARPSLYVAVDAGGLDEPQISQEELFFCDLGPGQDPLETVCGQNLVEGELPQARQDVRDDLVLFGVPERDDLPGPAPEIEDNTWRVPDGFPAGLDGWGELNYSWVDFDAGSSFEPGGKASGTFHLFFDGSDSQSRFHVRGRFEVDGWVKDFWTTDYLPPIKYDQNGTELCGLPASEVL